MPHHSSVLRIIGTLLFLAALLPASNRAGTWVAFQNTYTRGAGAPVTVTNTFTLLNPATQYTLKVFNGGLQNNQTELASYCIVLLNGVQVVGAGNFNRSVTELDVPVSPQALNTLSVEVLGQPGGVLALEIVGVDNDPPVISATVSPLPNAAGWNNSNVTVSFTCSDKTSGVAFCPSPVAVTTEGANQIISGTAMDLAGNTATASVTVNLDKTPPNIFGTINPPPDASGWNSSAVTVSFTCSDALSGVATCSAPVAITTEVVNDVVMGNATDVAGNTATTSVTVNISFNFFLVRSYMDAAAGGGQGKCLDYGTSPSGATVFLNDCNNAHPVRVTEYDANHDVVLHAGNLVIGIHNPPADSFGAPPPATAPEYALELQRYHPNLATTLNQVFALDGDSIILARNRPCFNSRDTTSATLCPVPPPPQMVMQVQNARGADGSPVVVATRNLADHEFWDFNAIDGSGKYPTKGFKPVATNYDLWNALCNPQVKPGLYIGTDRPPLVDPNQQVGNYLLPSTECTSNAGPGTVVVVTGGDPQECSPAIGACLELSPFPPITLSSGVTLRGTRRRADFGPQLYGSTYYDPSIRGFPPNHCESCAIEVWGDYVRVTELRVLGPSADTLLAPGYAAIIVGWPGPLAGPPAFSVTTMTSFIASIDHTEISQWGAGAVLANGPYMAPDKDRLYCQYKNGFDSNLNLMYQPYACADVQSLGPAKILDPTGVFVPVANEPGTLANLTVARNFLHHNELNNAGYGAGLARGIVTGNTYVSNRHAITASGEPHDEYRAWYNLVLSSAPHYATDGFNQDTDMHGTKDPGTWRGGSGGYHVDMFANTFFGTNRANYWLRGYPAQKTDFRGNISLRNQGDAVQLKLCLLICFNGPSTSDLINITPDNQFLSPSANPTNSLGVGDFDGDGVLDTFMATGAAFYYAPAGAREWRFLSAKTDAIDQLLFGDFDGDGRTDVVAMHGGQLVVSWGGVSDWEVLNATPCPDSAAPCAITDMAVGKFLAHPPGDLRDDIFYASGPTPNVPAGAWYLSHGGKDGFNSVNTSSFRRNELRFGDFDGDGTTDVLGVVSNTWSYSKSATGLWADGFLQQALDPIDNLVVADFKGDGKASVGESCGTGCWRISYDGTQPWVYNKFGSFDLVNGAVGHFGQNTCGNSAGADFLVWNVNEFSVVPCGILNPYLLSTQDMR